MDITFIAMLKKVPSHCATCKYSLAAHRPGQLCPECGVVIEYELVPDMNYKSLNRRGFFENPERFGCLVLALLAIAIPVFFVALMMIMEEIEYLLEN